MPETSKTEHLTPAPAPLFSQTVVILVLSKSIKIRFGARAFCLRQPLLWNQHLFSAEGEQPVCVKMQTLSTTLGVGSPDWYLVLLSPGSGARFFPPFLFLFFFFFTRFLVLHLFLNICLINTTPRSFSCFLFPVII